MESYPLNGFAHDNSTSIARQLVSTTRRWMRFWCSSGVSSWRAQFISLQQEKDEASVRWNSLPNNGIPAPDHQTDLNLQCHPYNWCQCLIARGNSLFKRGQLEHLRRDKERDPAGRSPNVFSCSPPAEGRLLTLRFRVCVPHLHSSLFSAQSDRF